jgi:transposase
MHRHAIRDEDWLRIQNLLPGRSGQPGVTAKDNRLFVDGVLWIAKTGAPWRDLPERFGNWNSVWKRFDRWAKKGVWHKLFTHFQDPDLEWLILDSTIIRAHAHAAGARKNQDGTGGQAEPTLGRSRGGWGTKIHAAVSGLMLPVTLLLTAGQEADVRQASSLLAAVPTGTPVAVVIADKGYDSKAVVANVEARGAEAVIPTLRTRKEQRSIDRERYKDRNLAERFWSKVKQFRRVATRYEKTARNFLATHLAEDALVIRLQPGGGPQVDLRAGPARQADAEQALEDTRHFGVRQAHPRVQHRRGGLGVRADLAGRRPQGVGGL